LAATLRNAKARVDSVVTPLKNARKWIKKHELQAYSGYNQNLHDFAFARIRKFNSPWPNPPPCRRFP
jgi:hypothetical protein